MQPAKAGGAAEPDLASLKIEDPAGYVNLDKQEASGLAEYIKKCQVGKKDLESTQKAYKICVDKNEIAPAWWQTPAGVIGIAVLSASVGALVSK